MEDYIYYKKNEFVMDVMELVEAFRFGDKEAFQELKNLAVAGNTQALLYLGEIYRDGKYGILPNGYEAINYFEKANAWWEIADIYLNGRACVQPDGYKAIEYFYKGAYWYRIAEIYRDGLGGVHIDKQKANEFLTKALESLIDQCVKDKNWHELFDLCRNGLDGVTPDGHRIIKILTEAEEWSYIAKIYRDGLGGVVPNLQKTIEFLSRAEQWIDIADIYLGLGNFKLEGYEAIKGLEEIEKILSETASKYLDSKCYEKFFKFRAKAEEVLRKIAEIYRDGSGGVTSDGKKAIKYFDKAGNYFAIAEIYRDGLGGVTPDLQKTIEFLSRAEQWIDIADIYLGLGNFKLEGYEAIKGLEEVEKILSETASKYLDPECDEKFFEFIAKAEEVLRKIAEIYRDGSGGVTPDGKKAIEYFGKAGDDFAIAEIYRDGLGGVPVDGYEAIEHFIKAQAGNEIAQIYENGCGEIKPDLQKATEIRNLIVKNGWDLYYEVLPKICGVENIWRVDNNCDEIFNEIFDLEDIDFDLEDIDFDLENIDFDDFDDFDDDLFEDDSE